MPGLTGKGVKVPDRTWIRGENAQHLASGHRVEHLLGTQDRQRALEADPDLLSRFSDRMAQHYRWRRRWRTLAVLALGFLAGMVTLFVLAAVLAPG